MKFSFQFDAPKYYSFQQKQPEKTVTTYLDPKSPEGIWFYNFNHRDSQDKKSPQGQPNLINAKENKENFKTVHNSKMDLKNSLNVIKQQTFDTIMNKPLEKQIKETSKGSIKQSQVQLPLNIDIKVESKGAPQNEKKNTIENLIFKPTPITNKGTNQLIPMTKPKLEAINAQNLYTGKPELTNFHEIKTYKNINNGTVNLTKEKIELNTKQYKFQNKTNMDFNRNQQNTLPLVPNQSQILIGQQPQIVSQQSFAPGRQNNFMNGFGFSNSFSSMSFQSFPNQMPQNNNRALLSQNNIQVANTKKVQNFKFTTQLTSSTNSIYSNQPINFSSKQETLKRSNFVSTISQPSINPNFIRTFASSNINPPLANLNNNKPIFFPSNGNPLLNNSIFNRSTSLSSFNPPTNNLHINRTQSASLNPPINNPPVYRTPPCLYPIRVQRQWQESHGRKWYQLSKSQIPKAEEQMRQITSRHIGGGAIRQSGNLNGIRNIFGGQSRLSSPSPTINNNNPQQNNQKKVPNPLFNRDHYKQFKF